MGNIIHKDGLKKIYQEEVSKLKKLEGYNIELISNQIDITKGFKDSINSEFCKNLSPFQNELSENLKQGHLNLIEQIAKLLQVEIYKSEQEKGAMLNRFLMKEDSLQAITEYICQVKKVEYLKSLLHEHNITILENDKGEILFQE